MAGAVEGGAETAFADTCVALAEAGTCVAVVTRGNNARRLERLRAAGIDVQTLPFGGVLDCYTGWRLRRIIAGFQPDIVQTWMNRAADKTPGWREGGKTPPYALFARFGGYYKLRHYKKTGFFIALTPGIAAWLQSQGIAADRIRQIPNFAETEEGVQAADRMRETTPTDAPLLIALGRLHRAKAFDILLRALESLPEVYLWIAGEGPERAALERQIAAAGLGGRVRLLGWRDDRAALLKAADICVFPSRFEPFGTIFLQAWASRKPLITTASDGPRQFVHDGENGLMVPVDDAGAFAAAIQRLLTNPELAGRLAASGFERYVHDFTKEKIVASYLAFYEQALALEKR
jgi:glycosyltransferase involved in cell wall biosynthesis